ncbi:GntR family transcriptional regulator [Sphingopyxis sp. SE2]|uniref:GntR family transcriptional regulator n=1 Tax=unclassified Sphingopyxis TaxID=2614943 RepID=UPI0009DEEA91|nr:MULTISPECIES: GntR family transcriptional regulator [unclassified Sphingopyxis]MDT7527854.1 GntR family transcriptional regulator [Sphingopyxis sp. SE2]
MCAARVLEHIYAELKERIMDEFWPQGTRLDPIKIADMLFSSTAPVREALRRLEREELVEYISGEGFYVPRIDEAKLRHLFEHHQTLILAAIKSSKDSSAISADGAYPNRVSEFFLQLGSRSGNSALIADISKHNNRLYKFRRCDSKLFEDIESELEDIIAAANDDPKGAKLRRLIKRFCNRRIAKVAEYIRLTTSELDSPSAP